MRYVSQVGQQGWGGPPNGNGFGGFGPGHHGGGHQSGMSVWQDLNAAAVPVEAFLGAESLGSPAGWYFLPIGSENSIPIPLAAIPGIIKSIWDFLSGGGNSTPPIPYQMRYHRHPIYLWLGIVWDLILTQESKAPEASGDTPSNVPPLQKPGYLTVQFHGYNYCGPGNNGGPTTPGTLDDCCRRHDNCYDQSNLSSNNVLPGHPGAGATSAQRKCDQAFCDCMRFSTPAGLADRFLRYFAEGQFCY